MCELELHTDWAVPASVDQENKKNKRLRQQQTRKSRFAVSTENANKQLEPFGSEVNHVPPFPSHL